MHNFLTFQQLVLISVQRSILLHKHWTHVAVLFIFLKQYTLSW